MNRLPLIEKLLYLESNLGERLKHPILEPFDFDSADPIQVQEAAKRIGLHLRMPTLTYIISYSHQKPNTGGNINIETSQDVFIELESDHKQNHHMVLAILAHEICHKYLHLNNQRLFPDYENEMLTDAATIFTGLGKLSLNGCERTSVSTERFGYETAEHTTTKYKIGYMDKKQFAFVYRLFCEMRKIPKEVVKSGLTPEALNLVSQVSETEGVCFNKRYFKNESIDSFLRKATGSDIENSQKLFARFRGEIRIIQESIIPLAIQYHNEYHEFARLKFETIKTLVNNSTATESQNYLKNLSLHEELNFLKSTLNQQSKQVHQLSKSLSKLIYQIETNYNRQFSTEQLEFLLQFSCPSCGHKMKIGEKKLVRITCPNCSYSFLVDTGSAKQY